MADVMHHKGAIRIFVNECLQAYCSCLKLAWHTTCIVIAFTICCAIARDVELPEQLLFLLWLHMTTNAGNLSYILGIEALASKKGSSVIR